jgi:hypothetical protein
LSRFLDLFLLQTLLVWRVVGIKKTLDRYEDRPFSYMHKNPVVFWWQLVWEGKALQGFSLYLKAPPCMEGAFINWRDLLPCDMQSFCSSSSKGPFILFFTGEVLFPRASSSFRFQGIVSSPILPKQVSHQRKIQLH